jgi:hypothetical protein
MRSPARMLQEVFGAVLPLKSDKAAEVTKKMS